MQSNSSCKANDDEGHNEPSATATAPHWLARLLLLFLFDHVLLRRPRRILLLLPLPFLEKGKEKTCTDNTTNNRRRRRHAKPTRRRCTVQRQGKSLLFCSLRACVRASVFLRRVKLRKEKETKSQEAALRFGIIEGAPALRAVAAVVVSRECREEERRLASEVINEGGSLSLPLLLLFTWAPPASPLHSTALFSTPLIPFLHLYSRVPPYYCIVLQAAPITFGGNKTADDLLALSSNNIPTRVQYRDSYRYNLPHYYHHRPTSDCGPLMRPPPFHRSPIQKILSSIETEYSSSIFTFT